MKTFLIVVFAVLACALKAGAAQPHPTPSPVTTVEVGTSSEHLTNGHGNWQSVYLAAAHEFAPRRVVYATVTTD
ncbi:MAG: hypothetical protein M3M96_09815, partial [Candidatus Eremiobacteraeota bacterium]|nr:hypothetical protein [Candidatus Eremiobacteraeota bacterium]